MISSLLLSREKYEQESRKYTGEYYTFEVKTDKQVLYYFGANHSRDPKNPQYPALKEYWQKFLETTQGKERIVLVEGRLREVEKDEETALRKGSEGRLITLLAHQAGVFIACPDVNDEELLEKLPQLNKDEVFLYYFLAWLNNFQKHADPKPDFKTSAETWLEIQKSRKIWQNTKTSFQEIKQLYRDIVGIEFDENKNPNNLVNPNRSDSIINLIARTQSDLRDANIASEIERYWNEGKSVFAVFGYGHLIIQKPALQAVLK